MKVVTDIYKQTNGTGDFVVAAPVPSNEGRDLMSYHIQPIASYKVAAPVPSNEGRDPLTPFALGFNSVKSQHLFLLMKVVTDNPRAPTNGAKTVVAAPVPSNEGRDTFRWIAPRSPRILSQHLFLLMKVVTHNGQHWRILSDESQHLFLLMKVVTTKTHRLSSSKPNLSQHLFLLMKVVTSVWDSIDRWIIQVAAPVPSNEGRDEKVHCQRSWNW